MSPFSRSNFKISEYGLLVITGGSSGIGYAIIERVRRLGSGTRICNLSRSNPHSFLNGAEHLHLECDLSDPAQRTSAFPRLADWIERSHQGKPILLVNNAGYGAYGPIESQKADAHLDMIEVNVSALVELTVSALPRLQENGGTIVNIASTAAFQPIPGFATYSAAKAFVLNWTIALNEELRGTRVRAVSVCPGPVATRFHQRAGLAHLEKPPGASDSPERIVDSLIESLYRKSPYAIPGFKNWILSFLSRSLPYALSARIAAAW